MNHLPFELLGLIFGCLDARIAMLTVPRVCRAWRTALREFVQLPKIRLAPLYNTIASKLVSHLVVMRDEVSDLLVSKVLARVHRVHHVHFTNSFENFPHAVGPLVAKQINRLAPGIASLAFRNMRVPGLRHTDARRFSRLVTLAATEVQFIDGEWLSCLVRSSRRLMDLHFLNCSGPSSMYTGALPAVPHVSLERVSVSGCGVGDPRSFQDMERMADCKEVNLECFPFLDWPEGTVNVVYLRSITVLRLGQNRLTGGLRHLSAAPTIEVLGLSGCTIDDADAGFAALKLPKLAVINVSRVDTFSPRCMQHIAANSPRLRCFIGVDANVTDALVQAFMPLSRTLKKVVVCSNFDLTGIGIRILGRLPQLQTIHMEDIPLRDDVDLLQPLCGLLHLRSLRIGKFCLCSDHHSAAACTEMLDERRLLSAFRLWRPDVVVESHDEPCSECSEDLSGAERATL
tara:strand:- start:5477 stop:6850 length:1374 start_codon:yes stop_codon:yes gene_type:complete